MVWYESIHWPTSYSHGLSSSTTHSLQLLLLPPLSLTCSILFLWNSPVTIISYGKLNLFLILMAKIYLGILMAPFHHLHNRLLLPQILPKQYSTQNFFFGVNRSSDPQCDYLLLVRNYSLPSCRIVFFLGCLDCALRKCFPHSRARIMQMLYQLATFKKGGLYITDYFQKMTTAKLGLLLEHCHWQFLSFLYPINQPASPSPPKKKIYINYPESGILYSQVNKSF